MTTPARSAKRASIYRPFPTLSLLCIYSSTPFPALDGSKQDDAQAEASKVLYLHSTIPDLTPERKARLMGTAIGMADFALAQDILSLVTESLKIPTFLLCGHDIGSMVASSLALLAGPDVVKALVVMECSLHLQERTSSEVHVARCYANHLGEL